MRKLLLVFSLLIFSYSLSIGQSWQWGREGKFATYNNAGGYGLASAIDNSGNVYITGMFEDSVSFGSTQLINGRYTWSVFLVKYDPNGNVLWAKQGNTIYQGEAYGVTIDALGNAYVTGYFQNTITFGAFKLNLPPVSNSTFLVKYDPNGNVLWANQSILPSTYSGSMGNVVATDRSGNIFMAGTFADTMKLGTITSVSKEGDFFLAKYNSSGTVIWVTQSNRHSTRLGYNVNAITTDKAGDIYITGFFSDTVSFGSYTLLSPTGDNLFLVKYNSSGNVVW
ncbi:MAG TPA: hypothetical protein VK890_11640, partial [Bacteroidia bacterium]|nr:hypothetical protein [Bacteroidia bacterium]